VRGEVFAIDRIQLDNEWAKSFKEMGVSKIGFYDAEDPQPQQNFLTEQVRECPLTYEPFKQALVTYLGFGFKPLGLLFRDVSTKDFRVVNTVFKKLSFYATQSFDEKVDEFQYGQPIMLVEGVLDAEACSHLTGYPYVIAYLSSYVNSYLAAVLSSITNRFVVIPDNDTAGEHGLNNSTSNLKLHKSRVKQCKLESKDFGDVYRNRHSGDVERAQLALKLA